MMSWLETLKLHSYDIREDNLSHGLAVVGQAADVVDVTDNGDGLSAVASAAPVVQEDQDLMCNGNSNEHLSEKVPSP
jgi:hypothetical protein